jgi:hypothetical protein
MLSFGGTGCMVTVSQVITNQVNGVNQIAHTQMLRRQLERLAAQRRLYSDAKTVLAIHMILSIPIVFVWAILVALFPHFRVYMAFWGVSVALLDVVLLTPLQKHLRKRAAKIQEMFDCDVLQMNWNAVKAGRRPTPEAIADAASRYEREDPGLIKLKEWYPPQVSSLPIYLARLVCQRVNCWWDAHLRRRYANYVVLCVGVLTVSVLLLGLIGGLTLKEFILAVLTPLTPAFILGLRQYVTHREAAASLDELRLHAEELWDKALEGEITKEQFQAYSRRLQDEILGNRSRNPLVFDWVYRCLRIRHEEQMSKGAETLIEEVRQAGLSGD